MNYKKNQNPFKMNKMGSSVTRTLRKEVKINLHCKAGKKLRSKKESKGHTPKNCWICY